MQNNINRASQFKSFDALKGFKEALYEVEQLAEKRKYIKETLFKDLTHKLQNLKIGDKVLIKHYYNLEYIETTGIIKKIDIINKTIYILNSKINFEDIINITIY